MEELPEITPPSAPETAPKRKKVIGRPITKENAKKAKETAEEYIAREYGEAIRAGNVSRMLEGLLVEIVKWRMDK